MFEGCAPMRANGYTNSVCLQARRVWRFSFSTHASQMLANTSYTVLYLHLDTHARIC